MPGKFHGECPGCPLRNASFSNDGGSRDGIRALTNPGVTRPRRPSESHNRNTRQSSFLPFFLILIHTFPNISKQEIQLCSLHLRHKFTNQQKLLQHVQRCREYMKSKTIDLIDAKEIIESTRHDSPRKKMVEGSVVQDLTLRELYC